jgi:dsRNA-specific ribonuclease
MIIIAITYSDDIDTTFNWGFDVSSEMAAGAGYRRALERVYTLLGKEYALVVVAVNSEFSGSATAARELLLAARSVSTEVGAAVAVRQVIHGPVVRLDLNSEGALASRPTAGREVNDIVHLNAERIKASFGGRVVPSGTPLVIALVGTTTEVITRLSDASCMERKELADLVTGGYLVLSYEAVPSMRLSWMELCDKPPAPAKRTTGTRVKAAEAAVTGDPKFLVETEQVGDGRVITYAVRLQPVVPVVATPVARPMTEPIRDPRWKQVSRVIVEPEIMRTQPGMVPQVARPDSLGWESMVQIVVERELSKLLPPRIGREQQQVTQLGDGLVVRVWPEIIRRISEDHDWTTVFTHQSVDPTPRANYEAFETLGDKILAAAHVHYLFSNGPTLDSNGITDSVKEILSRPRQSAMAVVMGFDQRGLIRSTVSVGEEILEDVYEAFFGCLFTVANRIIEDGNQGLSLCELLFRRVLKESFPDLDPWSVPKDAPTTLDQIFIRLGWGHPIVMYNEETRVATIRLTAEAITHLEGLGATFKRDRAFIVGPRAVDKPAATKAAAELALAALKSNWGIDTKYASLKVREKLMQDDRYAIVQRQALEVAKKMGYVDVYVARKAKNHNQLYAVLGVKPNDSEVQLHVYKYETGKNLGGGEDMSTRVAAYITALREFMASRA